MAVITKAIRLFVSGFGINFSNSVTNFFATVIIVFPNNIIACCNGKYNYQGGIIFVTAKGELDDCVQALNSGADDFVVKPYKIKELSARLNAILRRKDKPFIDKVYNKANIEINSSLHTVKYNDVTIQLRRKEFALFEMLFVNLNNILPRAAIFEKIWEDKLDTNMESLDSHIYMLRKSLKNLPEIEIKSIKNVGYKMEIKQ